MRGEWIGVPYKFGQEINYSDIMIYAYIDFNFQSIQYLIDLKVLK